MWIGQKWQYNRFNLPLILVGDTPSETREHLLLVLFVNLTSFYLQKDMLLLPFVSSRLLLALTCFMDSVFFYCFLFREDVASYAFWHNFSQKFPNRLFLNIANK